jgi:hypothetical protein
MIVEFTKDDDSGPRSCHVCVRAIVGGKGIGTNKLSKLNYKIVNVTLSNELFGEHCHWRDYDLWCESADGFFGSSLKAIFMR